MNIQLPIDVYSPDQLSELLLQLQTYTGELRDILARAKSGGHTTNPDVPGGLAEILKTAQIEPNNMTALEELAQQLQAVLNQSPVVHLVLAAMPGRPLKRQLTLWFRTEIHANTLITFAMRRDIGGGMIVTAGSHVYDLSLRRAVLANKQRITEIASV